MERSAEIRRKNEQEQRDKKRQDILKRIGQRRNRRQLSLRSDAQKGIHSLQLSKQGSKQSLVRDAKKLTGVKKGLTPKGDARSGFVKPKYARLLKKASKSEERLPLIGISKRTERKDNKESDKTQSKIKRKRIICDENKGKDIVKKVSIFLSQS